MPEHKRLHQQHWRQHWLKSNVIWGCIDNAEKRGLFKYLVVSFLAVSESPKWNAIKITLGFWGSRVPLHKVELNGTRQNGMKWNNYCLRIFLVTRFFRSLVIWVFQRYLPFWMRPKTFMSNLWNVDSSLQSIYQMRKVR